MEVSAGIHRVSVPLPFWSRDVNLYLIEDDDGYVLVDCGVNTEEAVQTLESYLQDIGCTFSDVARIVITHCHHDHYGMVGKIKERSQARVGMHSLEVERAECLYGRTGTAGCEIFELLLRYGFPRVLAAEAQKAAEVWRNVVWYTEIDEQLLDGQEMAVGSRQYRVLWTPGHSAGHVCLHDSDRRILIAGDHLLTTRIPHVGVTPYTGGNPLGDYMDSLRRVALLEIDLVLPGHGEPFSDHRERIDEITVHYSVRTEKVVEALGNGQRSAHDVARRAFGADYSSFEGRLGFTETLAHLELLASQGRIEKDAEGPVILFRGGRA